MKCIIDFDIFGFWFGFDSTDWEWKPWGWRLSGKYAFGWLGFFFVKKED